MIHMSLADAAIYTGCTVDSQLGFTGVTTDSRAVVPGMLFAAMAGAQVDGHDFIDQAVAAGAVAVLVERPVDCPVPQLRVANTLHALGELARAWRQSLAPRVAAITGSNGKTTTKELLASILRQSGSVHATAGNYNNELGLPLTLFGLSASHQFAVLEMGAGKAGDIRYLAGIAEPEVGLITNVGPAHLEGFGDEEGVARAKGELYAALPASGFAVLNLDEPYLPLWQGLLQCQQVLTFGHSPAADVRLTPAASGPRVSTPAGAFDLQLNLPGAHNVQNALAATAMALALDQSLDDIHAGLAATRPVAGRLNVQRARGGWLVIDDSYNANPASLKAALEVLTAEPGEAWLALGDMRELGANSDQLHATMGEMARTLGVVRLLAYGPRSRQSVQAFGAGGEHFSSREELLEALRADLHPGVCLLVKGSRSMGMEEVVAAALEPHAIEEAD